MQAELGDARIVEADPKSEVGAEAVDRRLEVTGGNDDLA